MTSRVRTILQADMDAFYASVEQHDRPELLGKPVIVGGSGGRGVVSTASYEARVFGVHSAMPAVQARKLCPQGIFLPGRMERYVEVAKQIRAVFGEFTPEVEPLSLDEAFLDVTASLQLFGSARAIGEQLKRRVREETGLAVSVGIGPTKMVAKIACNRGKPDGLVEILPSEVDDFLRPLSVSHLWGVGPATQQTLTRLGITTIGQLADLPVTTLEHHLGNSGRSLWELAHGHDHRVVDSERRRKSYGEEQTFDRDQRDSERLHRLLAEQAEAIARRLRGEQRRVRTVTLKFKLTNSIGPGKYPLVTRRLTLPKPTDDGPTLAHAAQGLWKEAHQGRPIRLLGMAVSSIEDNDAGQLGLFEAPSDKKESAVNKAVDALTQRFGRTVVLRGTTAPASTQQARSLGRTSK